jgi:methyl-accepting chemotaxis protein
MTQPRSTRSNYFIQAGLQIKFTFVLVMIVLLVATITFFNLYIIGDYVVQNTNTVMELRDMQSFLTTVFSIVGWRIVTLGVVCFLIITIIGIFYSHQFAGPSYKLEKCLKEISQGNLSFNIKLRGGDALHNVADSVNFLVDQFRGIVGKSRELSSAIRSNCEALSKEANEEVVGDLLKQAEELEDLLAGFHLTREEVQSSISSSEDLEKDEEEEDAGESSP